MSSTLTELIRPLAGRDGFSDTSLAPVSVVASHRPVARTPLVYEPSLTVIAQGQKIGHLGDREIHYNPGHYLVQTLPLPFECETFASSEQPLLGISIRIEPAVLGELVKETGFDAQLLAREIPEPMASVAMTQGMQEAVVRLLRALHDPLDAQVMGTARIREVIFEALKGSQGPALRALTLNQGHYARIVQVLTQMHAGFTDDMTVEHLARQANMSVSTFHQHFKQVAGSSPLQYVKRLRLIKSRLLLSHDDLNVNQTAAAVGYQSVHQFSRDYKRFFGVSPINDRQPSVLD
ncbi:AraC family transcriptional regulator [Marinobacter caseinilyticus]|uniref:AraC family transcriptional regulator n=1 Tax=Marinobacter caseinilyticus TaxID=2692195 RepID=UPI00140D1B4D|nr:AraC family transcriptional regulator [Marinobacter caseinilyticus]